MKFGLEGHKSSVAGTSRDRLSELPDEVLVHILSFLPTLDAVRTVLLRRFGNLWTLVHSLYFRERDLNRASVSSFLNFVRNILILHRRSTINKFHLDIEHENAEMEMWIRFALGREAKALIINFRKWPGYYTLPHCVFISQSIVSLELYGCKIEHQSRVHMGSLRKFALDSFHVSEKMLKEIISGCPSLEQLVIGHSYELKELRINSPSIKRLKLHGWAGTLDCPRLQMLDYCANVKDVVMIDVSSVIEAKIEIWNYPSEESAYPFLSLWGKIGNAEVLELTELAIGLFAYCSMKEPAFPHSRAKHFILKSGICGYRMLAICRLVRNSPYLEELTIYADREYYQTNVIGADDYGEITEDLDVPEQELSSPCVLTQLKTVTMHGFENYSFELAEFSEFLLKSAVNLDKMLFLYNCLEQPDPEWETFFVKRLASFPRASPNARVLFA